MCEYPMYRRVCVRLPTVSFYRVRRSGILGVEF
jgi:hypothetical protein